MILKTVVSMAAVAGVLSLCVDIGLRRAVVSELRTVADAAALAGATRLLADGSSSLSLGTVRAAACETAGLNDRTLSTSLAMRPSDVELGMWDTDTRTFTPRTIADASTNAVRVTAHRSADRSNAIPTVLAGLLGIEGSNATASAVAAINGPLDYALIGLDEFTARGVLTVDASPWTGRGSIASNGNVTLNLLNLVGVTLIDGHISTNGQVKKPLVSALTYIRDGVQQPAKPFVLPPVSTANAEQRNDNANIDHLIDSAGRMNVTLAADIPPGTYYVKDLNVLAGAMLRFTGPTTIYVQRDVSVLGTVLVLDNDPRNLKLRVAGPGDVEIAANVALTADVYAPKSDISLAAGVVYRGRLIGRKVLILGTSMFYLWPNLPTPETGGSRVSIVQ